MSSRYSHPQKNAWPPEIANTAPRENTCKSPHHSTQNPAPSHCAHVFVCVCLGTICVCLCGYPHDARRTDCVRFRLLFRYLNSIRYILLQVCVCVNSLRTLAASHRFYRVSFGCGLCVSVGDDGDGGFEPLPRTDRCTTVCTIHAPHLPSFVVCTAVVCRRESDAEALLSCFSDIKQCRLIVLTNSYICAHMRKRFYVIHLHRNPS